ncbi:MAG: hypothetical protein K8S97_04560 [Anaerolineae bacterium]|nr:hypothetical protein [Anaerolineae bacterium]
MSRTPGIDVSRWQGEINWGAVAAQGYRFAVIRATVGNYYTDPRFYENWKGAQAAGLLVSAYHVTKPKQSAQSQIDRLFDVLAGRTSDLPLVLDVELADGQTAATITGNVKECCELVARRAGRKPVIYTGTWFWNPNLLRRAEWAEYDLWIANYGASSPTLPQDWSEWVIWQHSEKGSVSGVSSTYTDLNWFNGSYEDLLAYCKPGHDPADRPVEGSGEAPKRLRARVTSRTLRVRSGPGVNYDHIGDLQQGEVIDVLAVDGSEVWVAFAPGRWAALKFQGQVYLEVEEE